MYTKQVENGDEQFWILVRGDFFYFDFVPIKFPRCSQNVPQYLDMIPKNFPIALYFQSHVALSIPKINEILCSLSCFPLFPHYRYLIKGSMTKLPFIFGGGKHIQASMLGSAPCSKIFVGRPIKWLLLEEEKKKKTVGAPLTNLQKHE